MARADFILWYWGPEADQVTVIDCNMPWSLRRDIFVLLRRYVAPSLHVLSTTCDASNWWWVLCTGACSIGENAPMAC